MASHVVVAQADGQDVGAAADGAAGEAIIRAISQADGPDETFKVGLTGVPCSNVFVTFNTTHIIAKRAMFLAFLMVGWEVPSICRPPAVVWC